MTTLLIYCLTASILPMLVDASRADMQAIMNRSRDEAAITMVPKFSFQLKKTLCAKLDFGNMQIITKNYPKAVRKLQEQGTLWAKSFNCRLCDLEGDEENLLSPVLRSIEVKCHAFDDQRRTNLEEACNAGNGKTGWRHDDNVCLPCPEGCEYCKKAGASDMYSNFKWFKCILPTEESATRVQPPWACEAIQDRRNHPGRFQWCKYRHDLDDSPNAFEPEPTSTWNLKITASRCENTAYEAKENTAYEAKEHISAMVKLIAPKLNRLSSQNCEICRIMLGGTLAPAPLEEIAIGEGTSENWVDAKCAFDEFGSAACRPDRGLTGWTKIHKCAPCPLECSSCEDQSTLFGNNKRFKCNLRYSAGAGDRIQTIMTGESSDYEVPAVPEGFDCDKAVKKKCQTGRDVCLGGYKTQCRYKYVSY